MDVDVRFGPFTCIAGVNGVGKSNLFDAIRFLSALSDHSLVEAALSVRDELGRTSDIKSLFHRSGKALSDRMSFEAEMIVPASGVDDLGQTADASITFLRYSVTIARRTDDDIHTHGSLELLQEDLSHITLGEANQHLAFDHSVAWRRSAVKGRRTSPFISTEGEGVSRLIRLHQDGRAGRASARLATALPRTVLSVANAAESPTVLLARREMQSWKLLQLEPSSLRRPDEFTAPTKLGVDGSHLPATLNYLARSFAASTRNGGSETAAHEAVYAGIANRLSELIDDVRTVRIDRDERRELLTLEITDRSGTTHPARALSDGTLRFLALAVLDLDPAAQGLLCLEEPENGIHPERIPAMLRLLESIAVDVNDPIGQDNPLRQVIINTHSPSVVSHVDDDSLLVATLVESTEDGKSYKGVYFAGLPGTWRQSADELAPVISKGDLIAYLNPLSAERSSMTELLKPASSRRRKHRVMDREDLQLMLPLSIEQK